MPSKGGYPGPSTARIDVVLGDITDEETDVIVSSASPHLTGASGVEGAIRRRAGDRVLDECRRLREISARVGAGVLATGAGDLAARQIVHATGPNHDAPGAARDLARCYVDALCLAERLGASTIALPAISAGRRGYPVSAVATIALRVVRDASTRMSLVRFVLYDKDAYYAFVRAFVATL